MCVGCYKVNIFFLFFFVELSRFYYKKDFIYNYEGEIVSSVVGVLLVCLGLRICVCCVVKVVGLC